MRVVEPRFMAVACLLLAPLSAWPGVAAAEAESEPREAESGPAEPAAQAPHPRAPRPVERPARVEPPEAPPARASGAAPDRADAPRPRASASRGEAHAEERAPAPLAPPVAVAEQPARELVTSGHGEVKVRPDSMRAVVAVESQAPTLEEARRATSQRARRIAQALEALGIPGLSLRTKAFRVQPIHSVPKDGKSEVVGHRALSAFEVAVEGAPSDRLAELGARLIDTALESGANEVGGLELYVADPREARSQALRAAVEDARRSAEAMAAAAGVRLEGLTSVEGSADRPTGPVLARDALAALEATTATGSTAAEPAGLTLVATVQARYRFAQATGPHPRAPRASERAILAQPVRPASAEPPPGEAAPAQQSEQSETEEPLEDEPYPEPDPSR